MDIADVGGKKKNKKKKTKKKGPQGISNLLDESMEVDLEALE